MKHKIGDVVTTKDGRTFKIEEATNCCKGCSFGEKSTAHCRTVIGELGTCVGKIFVEQKPFDLRAILCTVPAGTKFFTTVWGYVKFQRIATEGIYVDKDRLIRSNGSLSDDKDAECIIFPDKDQRDWSKFALPLRDNELVWAWNDRRDYRLIRVLGFYDSKTGFLKGVDSNCRSFDHYERYKGEWPQWAKEAKL